MYRSSQRGGECPIRDVRGPVVGTIATPQTFLTSAEVNGLLSDYLTGATVAELAARYKVHRATVSKHLTRQGVVRRTPGLHRGEAAEVELLYRQGASMRAIANSLRIARSTVRRVLVSASLR